VTGSKWVPMSPSMYLYLIIDPHSSWDPAKLSQLYNFKNFTIHSRQISQHVCALSVCTQANNLLPHIYNTKSMCTCVYSAYVIVCYSA
jgi:hypothetical protein